MCIRDRVDRDTFTGTAFETTVVLHPDEFALAWLEYGQVFAVGYPVVKHQGLRQWSTLTGDDRHAHLGLAHPRLQRQAEANWAGWLSEQGGLEVLQHLVHPSRQVAILPGELFGMLSTVDAHHTVPGAHPPRGLGVVLHAYGHRNKRKMGALKKLAAEFRPPSLLEIFHGNGVSRPPASWPDRLDPTNRHVVTSIGLSLIHISEPTRPY